MRFSRDLALTVLWASLRGLRLTIGEVWRDPERQKRLVAEGLSWTLNSDHLEGRAVDFQLYDGDWRPVHDPEAYRDLGAFFVGLDPAFNYWGFAEWGKDAYHFGRRRQTREVENGTEARTT